MNKSENIAAARRLLDYVKQTGLELRPIPVEEIMETKNLYTVAEIAELTRYHKNTVYQQIRQGRLKAVQLGSRLIRVSAKDVNDWWRSGGATEPLVPES